MNRREFLKTTAVAGASLLSSQLFRNLNTAEAQYRKPPLAEQVPISLVIKTKEGFDIGQEALERIKKVAEKGVAARVGEAQRYLKSQYPQFNINENPKSITVIVTGVQRSLELFAQGELSPNKSQKIKQIGQEVINHAVSFWQNEFLKQPIIEFTVPAAQEETLQELPSFNLNQKVLIQLIKYQISHYTNDVFMSFPFLNNPLPAKMIIQLRDTAIGQADRSLKINLTENKKLVLDQNRVRLPVWWIVGDFPENKKEQGFYFKTPVLETLHSQVSDYTNNHIIKELNISQRIKELFQKKPIDLNKIRQEEDVVIHKILAVEEVLVHAIGQIWLDVYNYENKLNLPVSEIKQRIGAFTGTDKIFNFLMEKITPKQKSLLQQRIKETIKEYINDWKSIEEIIGI